MSLALLRDWIVTPLSDRRLVSNFARQEFYAQFTASMGGFLWLILTPIANILIYAFVFSYIFKARAAEGFGETAFVLFMMIGYLPWFAFADSIGRSTSLLLEKAPLITKVKFPVQVIPVVGTLVPYITHAIGFSLLLLYLATQGYVNSLWVLLPFIFFLQMLFTAGLVAILSSLSVFLRDLQQLVALGINVWFFLTPIIYPLSMIQSDSVKEYFLLNPMHSFVNLYREIVLRGELPLINLQIVIVVSLVSYLFGGWLFMRIKHAFGDVL
jgi:lipopolysaccharide transport system permease protein